jgi:hypothetical protein
MPIVTRVNLPIGPSKDVFLNREGLERLKKLCPRESQSMRKFTIFKTPRGGCSNCVAPFETKKKQHWKKVTSKKNSEG